MRSAIAFYSGLLLAVLGLTLLAFKPGDEKDWSECIKKTSFQWGSECKTCAPTSKTYRAWFKNVCSDTVAVKIAVQENHKRWKTFTRPQLLPGDSISGFACIGTGKYQYWAKKYNDNTIAFPSDEEINSANGF